MRYSLIFLFVAVAPVLAAPHVAPTDPLSPEEQRAKFQLPPGFEIQLVASEPEIGQPMNLRFDARGRLWVTHSVEYPYPAKENARDALTVFSGIDEEGQPASITRFATGLNIPIGQAPLGAGDEALVYSIPAIFRVSDTDGDGVSEARKKLFSGFGFDDTHGMASSFRPWIDGWVYGCHGFRNTSTVQGTDGHVVEMQSGNTYRFRSDGSRIEVFTRGMVNPFGLTMDSWGNIYAADCHSKPLSLLLPGAHYPSFGKPHDGLGFAPAIIDHTHGSTGICGPAWYEAEAFPPAYRDSIYLCNPVTGRVHQDRLNWTGSSPKVDSQEDFIRCDDPWFRPVDACTGPDGALYIADFYNAIIGHYEVKLDHPKRDRTHGRVWRVVYTGEEKKAKPHAPPEDLVALSDAALSDRLDHPNLELRTLATELLVDRAKIVLSEQAGPARRAHSLWVIERGSGLTPAMIATAARDPEPLVRVHLQRVLAERDTLEPAALDLLRSAAREDAHALVRRAAIEALGRHPGVENVACLAPGPGEDPMLRHSRRIALARHLRVGIGFDEAAKSPGAFVDIALAVKSADSGAFLYEALMKLPALQAREELLTHAARFCPKPDLLVLGLTEAKVPADFAVKQLLALNRGFQQRGGEAPPGLRSWAASVVTQQLDRPAAGMDWAFLDAGTPSPWTVETRPCADGVKDALFHSSRLHETRVGMYRSGLFKLEQTFHFYLAGHNGLTSKPPTDHNLVRLVLESGEVIREARPPRNDTAQRIAWELAEHAGKQAVFELVDRDTRAGYAWLAAGRFSVPALNPGRSAKEALAGVRPLIRDLKLQRIKPQLLKALQAEGAGGLPREAAGALLDLEPDARLSTLLEVTTGLPDAPVFAAVAERDDLRIEALIREAFLRAPSSRQQRMAERMAGDPIGGESLLKLAEAQLAAPRLLQDAKLAGTLKSLKLADGEARIAAVTRDLPEADRELEDLIKQRVLAHAKAAVSVERGAAQFKTLCSACHAVGGQGGNIGPGLDGIGLRGSYRLIEDILDPNLNVDANFRTTLITRKDDSVVAGIFRRREGDVVIIADATGKELAIPASEITARSELATSPMPPLARAMPEADFHDLVAWLLSLKEADD